MSNRDTWLELTSEDAFEPDLPICDPHHHLWDYPGSRYMVDDFLADLGGGHNVVKTVFVECRQFYNKADNETLRPVGETIHVDQMASEMPVDFKTRVAAGIVGFADLTLGDAVRPVLEAHLDASNRFRGIRHASAWDSDEKIHNAHTQPPQHLLGSGDFRNGVAQLTDLGLSFDAWLYHMQIPELTNLARANPELSIVLDHMAGPLGIGPYAGKGDDVFQQWKKHMAMLSRCENVTVKLGGRAMTMSGFGWHKLERPPGSRELAATMAPYFNCCIDLFGPQRCMFESNFPVDRASCSYTVLWNTFKRISRGFSDTERAALFHDTAVRVYRLAS
jgi:L-fuconolactonase